jgi:bifunctional ADP-heptose synthase (sugar kinase/adenylyltransferase)
LLPVGDILIIGESCRDVFVYCEAERLCPDIPVPVLSEIDRSENPGMAKNVHRNILSLYSDCDIITNRNWTQITKTRYVHKNSNHTFFRVDTPHKMERVDVQSLDLNYDLIVISDYNKGFLLEEDVEYICNKHNNVFIDTKKNLGSFIQNAKIIKINDFEYRNSKKFIDNNENIKNKIIHTQGGTGCFYKEKNFPVNEVEVKDTSGAGDSFMAALVVKYAEGNDMETSINFANFCASNVVKGRGVGVI